MVNAITQTLAAVANTQITAQKNGANASVEASAATHLTKVEDIRAQIEAGEYKFDLQLTAEKVAEALL